MGRVPHSAEFPTIMDLKPNPNAPPVSEETEADAIRGWRVVGEVVFARRGATLPMIDLLTGNESGALLRVRLAANPLSALLGESVWIYSEDNLPNQLKRAGRFIGRLVILALIAVYFLGDFIQLHWLQNAVRAGWILLAVLWLQNLTVKKLTIQPSVKQGWLRISPIHPKAITHLRAAKADQAKQAG